MGKRLTCLLLACLLILGCGATALAAPANEFEIYVDGVPTPKAYSMLDSGITWVSISGVTHALRPGCTERWENGFLVLEGEDFTLSAHVGYPYIAVNGRYLYLAQGVRFREDVGQLMVPVRLLGSALGSKVGWSEAGVFLYTGGAALQSGDTYYDAQSVDLIARVVQHESGNQSLLGKIAVAECIVNRVKAGAKGGFANTVYGVVYQRGQFPGATNATPKAQAIIAAKIALEGSSVVPGAKWFNGVGVSCWAKHYKRLIANIGGHSFYG